MKQVKIGAIILALVGCGLIFEQMEDGATATVSTHPIEKQSQNRREACVDEDGDGFGLGCTAGPDCNDFDATVHPAQPDVCNFRDDNCNYLVDESEACPVPPLNKTRVFVSAGSFPMGSIAGEGAPDEHPQHSVELSSFYIDRYEVTTERYKACVDAGVCTPPTSSSSRFRTSYFGNAEFADYPVVFTNWQQAATFCSWDGGRLPREAEWEKAARGTQTAKRLYPWGNAAPDCSLANVGGADGCIGDTDRVGRRTKGVSPYGVQDMAGNVWEWVSDWYDGNYYKQSEARDPRGPQKGRLKVMRGGCFLSKADSLRVTCRKAELPQTWAYNVGFRCVYDAATEEGR